MSVSNLGDLLAKSREERTSTETLYSEILDLLTESLKDKEAEVRAAAAKSLGLLRDKKSIPALKKALKDEEAEVRAAVVEALGRYAALISGNVVVDTPTKLSTKE
jgi:HEAT repeat protein